MLSAGLYWYYMLYKHAGKTPIHMKIIIKKKKKTFRSDNFLKKDKNDEISNKKETLMFNL